MPFRRPVVHIAIVRSDVDAGRSAALRGRIEAAIEGAEVWEHELPRDECAPPPDVLRAAGIVIVFAGASLAECHRTIDRTVQQLRAATEPAGPAADRTPTARIVAIADFEHPPRTVGPIDVIAGAAVERELVPYLRGLVACAAPLREAQRELGLLGRVAESMRRELEERDEELRAAALVQRDFLPEPMAPLHGVEVGVLSRPLSKVTGDVFHVERVDADRIAILLVDAVGHGMPAALLGTAICRMIESTEREGGVTRVLGPGEMLERLNRRLCAQQRRTTRFATAVAALLDCRRRRLVLASAGHPPAVLLRAGCAPQPLEAEGAMLGVFADERYLEVEVDLETTDRLLLHSDGFEEAFAEGGVPAHVEAFGALGTTYDAREYVRPVEERLDARGGALHQRDDLTLLCIAIGAARAVRRAA